MLKRFYNASLTEAGCDEAGRGCLAGPVVAAAVMLPRNFRHKWMNDSKKLNEKQREELRPLIQEKAITWAIGIADQHEIDKFNILNATFLAMHRAIDKLLPFPQFLIVDGNRFKKHPILRHQCIIRGDGLYLSIAAASILAKTHRDELMKAYHLEYPQYRWDENKGYGTKAHVEAIRVHGTCELHRRSFKLQPSGQLRMENF